MPDVEYKLENGFKWLDSELVEREYSSKRKEGVEYVTFTRSAVHNEWRVRYSVTCRESVLAQAKGGVLRKLLMILIGRIL